MPVEFHPYKNTKAEIDNIQIKEGQLLFSTDEKKIYLDNSDTERIEVGGGENNSNSSGTTINNWTAATAYKVGDLVINEATLYQCITEHISEQAFNETETANWVSLSGAKGEKGDKGEDGIDGTNGVSPSITTTPKEDNSGTIVTIIDVNGTKSFDVLNGVNGADGISPAAIIIPTDTGATISITDKNGTTSAVLTNGTDGITPHIDVITKHWFIGEIDTGIVAEGIITVQTTAVEYTGTLIVENWFGDVAPYTQTVNITGITAEVSPIIDLIISDSIETGLKEITQWNYITKATTGDNNITFMCYDTKPNVTLNFKVKVV